MLKKLRHIIIAGAALSALCLPAAATTFDEEALDAYVSTSTACVIGQVKSSEYVMNHGMVFTKTTVAVSDHVFGSTGSEITVLTPGGVVPNTKYPVAQIVASVPTFTAGQDVMLVLNTIPQSSSYAIAGLSDGVIKIVGNTGQREVMMRGQGGMMPLRDAMQRMRSLRNGNSTIELR